MLFSLIFYHDRGAGTNFAGARFSGDGQRPCLLGRFHSGYPLSGSGLEETNAYTSKPGAVPMNFAAKLNVVAAYAAFAFVCAIVFGMV